jgi:hypothetical protein
MISPMKKSTPVRILAIFGLIAIVLGAMLPAFA